MGIRAQTSHGRTTHADARRGSGWPQADIPSWDKAICAAWRASGPPRRALPRGIDRQNQGLRDAWWRLIQRYVYRGAQNRFGREHRKLGRRRWDELIQKVLCSTRSVERDACGALEATFIAQGTRVLVAQVQ